MAAAASEAYGRTPMSEACARTLQDLLGDLDRAAEAGRKAATDVRPDHGPRIMTAAEEGLRAAWRPPPSRNKEDVKREMQADRARNFARFGKQAGSDFEPACSKRLKPQVLDPWTEERKDVPDRTFAKSYSTIQFHAHSEPLPEPHSSLCSKHYQEVLRQHQRERDKHINPVYHALQRVKKVEEQLQNHEYKRQLTRDMVSRSAALALPTYSNNVKSTLAKARRAIATGRQFGLAVGVDRLAQEEDRDKARLEKAKSAPALALHPQTPQGAAKHLRNWTGPDHPARCLRESTPWREHDEGRALKSLAEARR